MNTIRLYYKSNGNKKRNYIELHYVLQAMQTCFGLITLCALREGRCCKTYYGETIRNPHDTHDQEHAERESLKRAARRWWMMTNPLTHPFGSMHLDKVWARIRHELHKQKALGLDKPKE